MRWICIAWILKMNRLMQSGVDIRSSTLLPPCKFSQKYTGSQKIMAIFSPSYLLPQNLKNHMKDIGTKFHNISLNIFWKYVISRLSILEQHIFHIKGKMIILKYVPFARRTMTIENKS